MRTNKMPAQGEFNLNFEVRPRPARAEGLTVWHRELDQTAREVADKLGLPVGRLVEVRLKDGVIVKGNLRAGEVVQSLKAFDRNKVALEIGGLVFFLIGDEDDVGRTKWEEESDGVIFGTSSLTLSIRISRSTKCSTKRATK